MKRTTKKMIKLMALVLSLVLVFPLQAQAALPETVEPQSNPYIISQSGNLITKGDGKLSIDFHVSASGIMKKVGIQTIVLYESTDNYNYFPVQVYHSYDHSNMMGSNVGTHDSHLSYTGVARRYYQASFVTYVETKSGATTTTTFWSLIVRAT